MRKTVKLLVFINSDLRITRFLFEYNTDLFLLKNLSKRGRKNFIHHLFSREGKRFGEIEIHLGSVGQGCGWEFESNPSLSVSRSWVALTTERGHDGEGLKKELRRRGRDGTWGIYSTAVTLLRITLPRCVTVIAQSSELANRRMLQPRHR